MPAARLAARDHVAHQRPGQIHIVRELPVALFQDRREITRTVDHADMRRPGVGHASGDVGPRFRAVGPLGEDHVTGVQGREDQLDECSVGSMGEKK